MTDHAAPGPLDDEELTALTDYLGHASPVAFSVPNETVARLLAMLDDERRRADIAELDLVVALDNWKGDG